MEKEENLQTDKRSPRVWTERVAVHIDKMEKAKKRHADKACIYK